MRRRAGSALIVVLLGLLLLEGIVLGTLAIASNGVALAGLDARRLQARLAAESAVRATLAHWTGHAWDTLAAGAVRIDTSAFDGAAVVVEHVAAGRFLIRASAPGLGSTRTLAQALVSTLPFDSLRHLFDAALHVSSPVHIAATARLDGTAAAADGACPEPPAPALVGDAIGTVIEPGAGLAGSPPFRERTDTVADGIAGIPFPSLRPLADHAVAGVITPRAGPCDGSDPLDWGDPSGSDPRCAEHRPFIVAAGDLVLSGGSGQGVLLVAGRLRMTAGARFDGAIIAGSLELVDGSVTGAVHTFAGDTTRVAGTVRYDGCSVAAALATRALRRPFRHGSRLWLPTR